MLLKDFYTINSLTNIDGVKYVATITINKDHEVFKGHFPGNPVTPGVCMMQIIKELTQQVVDAPLFMKSASNIKFMALINPEVNANLKLELEIAQTEDNTVKIKNTTFFDDTVALKLTCIYSKN
ncbi:hotdog family protein [Flavobacterium subsaxonicum]|uniref:3-hydroxyacyl-ACP dehydratase n=1 Tax=Flavobacterium subsaxonicum WB 4.1-42 = DSM 21790 TaxID=1121898 RepID=A0A0A2MIK7_9FLAO|nr:3-hydroxyacyl-ACP dehydratase [Flavobacterium subsaxonicum]KGO91298.1 3-hydroxyacyl-ACP dehydratase [Flavobacterium subsaxonicum WB 4.1-42 = DSM 21790]